MTEKKNISLFIHQGFPHPGGIRVYGACCQEPIAIGDTFDLVYELLGHLHINPQSANYKVVSLKAYGHFLDSIDSGLTAEIVLHGEAARPLKSGDILGTKAYYRRSPSDALTQATDDAKPNPTP